MEYPKADAGLAEWTSKIKAMQREVETDEEVEQRRLEEEIKASRLARSRRSIGIVMPSVEVCAYIIRLSLQLFDPINNEHDTSR